MNAIIRKHYPVSKLPSDLRQGLGRHDWVDIEIKVADVPDHSRESLADLVGTGTNVHGAELAVLDHVRALREDR